MTIPGTDLTKLHINITDANGKQVLDQRWYSQAEALDALDGVLVSLMTFEGAQPLQPD